MASLSASGQHQHVQVPGIELPRGERIVDRLGGPIDLGKRNRAASAE